MKRKKVMTITALVFTCATIASCGKTTETVNAEPVIQATEQIVLETEEIIQVSADQGEGEQGPVEIDGKTVYPDYEEKYVKYEAMEPKEMYYIASTSIWFNPNMTEGILQKWGIGTIGDTATVDGKCEIDGTAYYRLTPTVAKSTGEMDNVVRVVVAEALSDTPPSDDDMANQDTSNSGNSPYADGEEVGDGFVWEDSDADDGWWDDLPEAPSGDGSDVPDELLDQAEGMIIE